MKKAGAVAIVGRPNVGKSTLLNYLVGEKVAIVSPVPQTTRHRVRAILNEERGQIVLLDTPGMHVPKNALDRAMIVAIDEALAGADAVVHLVDVTERLGEEEEMMMARLSGVTVPIILGLNKIDRSERHLKDYLDAWEKRLGKSLSAATDRLMPVPFSALQGTNVSRLLDELFLRMPEGEPLFPGDVLTDFPRQLTIQDIIREKLLYRLREEVPFSIAVYAEEITEKSDRLTYVKASILVERESQKGIVIGKKGEVLKGVGQEARKDLENIYEKRFYLDLWVKVDENWKQDHDLLMRMGYIAHD